MRFSTGHMMAAAFGDARADAPVGELDIYIYIYKHTRIYTFNTI